MVEQEQALVAFLAVRPTQDGEGYLGGLMVIDEAGVPQEFRCTHPVRPTDVQRALYGGSLRPHVFNTLIGVTLIRASTTSPVFCCVEEPILLQMAKDTDMPVVHLQRIGEALSVDSPTSDGDRGSDEARRIDSQYGGFQPLSATFHHGYESDLEKIKNEMERVFNQVDLLEPFDRIGTALRVLAERDKRFR